MLAAPRPAYEACFRPAFLCVSSLVGDGLLLVTEQIGFCRSLSADRRGGDLQGFWVLQSRPNEVGTNVLFRTRSGLPRGGFVCAKGGFVSD